MSWYLHLEIESDSRESERRCNFWISQPIHSMKVVYYLFLQGYMLPSYQKNMGEESLHASIPKNGVEGNERLTLRRRGGAY